MSKVIEGVGDCKSCKEAYALGRKHGQEEITKITIAMYEQRHKMRMEKIKEASARFDKAFREIMEHL